MVETTNQGFIDENGKHMVRCWGRRKIGRKWEGVMYVVPMHPSEIPRAKKNLAKEVKDEDIGKGIFKEDSRNKG